MSSRSRQYAWTLNNYSQSEAAAIRGLASNPSVVYLCFAPEVGESGTPHLQGYVYFKDARTISSCKELLGRRAHVEQARGTPAQNKTYCCGPWTGSNFQPIIFKIPDLDHLVNDRSDMAVRGRIRVRDFFFCFFREEP